MSVVSKLVESGRRVRGDARKTLGSGMRARGASRRAARVGIVGPHDQANGDFGLVIQTLDDSAGELLARMKVVEDQFSMGAYSACELLHWFDA